MRSEEHTSELQSQSNLVCRLLLEKKKKTPSIPKRPPTSFFCFVFSSWEDVLLDLPLRASNEHMLIVRVPRAGGRPGCPSHSQPSERPFKEGLGERRVVLDV